MADAIRTLWHRLFPAAPDDIADLLAMASAARLQSQCRLLCLLLALTVPGTLWAQNAEAAGWVRIGLPLLVGAMFLGGFLSLLADRRVQDNARRARRYIREATWASTIIAIPCSLWTVMSWHGAATGGQAFYPLILVLGSLTTAYCLSTVPLAAVLNLAVGVVPITILMLASGDRFAMAAAGSIMVAAGFQLRMVAQQHRQLVDLLALQSDLHHQALTDPLTRLGNRRMLTEALDARTAAPANAAQGPSRPFWIALIDLDGFKAVNDHFGHVAGDALLCEVALRLRAHCPDDSVLARIGGDEFAVLVGGVDARGARRWADRLLAAMVPAFGDGNMAIRIGASIGIAHWPVDGHSAQSLLERADRRLYAAKAQARRPARRPTKKVVAATA